MKFLKKLLPYTVIVAAALLLLYLPDIAPERYSDLATFFRVEMKRQGYAGFSVAAVSDGSVLYVDGFGVDGRGKALGPDSILYAPAAAKSMAALAAYSLVRDRLFSLDLPVRNYLPWFSLPGARGAPASGGASGGAAGGATIRNLISHTTGLSDTAFDDAHPAAPDLETAVHSMVGAVPKSAPGASFNYMDSDYQALALAMEKATGKSYAAILSERIFRPLGMSSSSALGTEPLPRGSVSFFAIPLPRSAPRSVFGAPSGYVLSTASDMGQYLAFLLGPEKFKRGPVPARSVPTLFEPLLPSSPYGFGLFLGQAEGSRFAYHDGSLDGFSSRIALWPAKRTGVAVLAAQSSLLQSLVSLPALTDGARRIVMEGSAPRPFPLGRLYILLAVAACVNLFALALQTGGALRWAKEARDKAEAKGSRGPTTFAAVRTCVGIGVRAAVAIFCPTLVGLLFSRAVSWGTLFALEPGLAVWCLSACMFGFLRNAARLAWLHGPGPLRRSR